MVTVHREGGFRFVIFTDDHEPSHVHVYGDGSAKIAIVGAEGAPELIRTEGMKAGDLRKVMRIVAEQQAVMLDRWRTLHG